MREIHPGRDITIKMSNKAKPAMTTVLVDSRCFPTKHKRKAADL